MGMFSTITGRVLSHYEVGTLIGTGGMGHVYNGRDLRLDRPVAIKVLPHWARGDRSARERLLKEARAAAAVAHPHIVTVYDIGHHRGVDLLVMEFLPGNTLEKSIPRRGFPVSKALDVAIQIAEALCAAHSARILHRDLKPSNVMLDKDKWATLLDFGLAELSDIKLGRTKGTTVPPGTKRYMAPEQLGGERGDARSEIFSFGLILHEMLSGQHPFKRPSPKQTIKAIQTKDPATLPPKVPALLKDLIRRCLKREPANRFGSIEDALTALREFQQTLGGDSTTTRPAQKHTPASPAIRSVRAIMKRIGYKSLTESRHALGELGELFRGDPSDAVRDLSITALKKMILTLDEYGGNPIPGPVREVRCLVMGVLKLAAQGSLNQCFEPNELEFLDLYAMDLSDAKLAGLSFSRAKLIESKVRNSDLTGVSFASGFIRNVDFTGANLLNADFTDADWFNALGLTEGQLKSAQRHTLLRCPADVAGMHQVLEARYVLPFDSWPERVQEQLIATWREYLRPDGLRDIVAAWRTNRQ